MIERLREKFSFSQKKEKGAKKANVQFMSYLSGPLIIARNIEKGITKHSRRMDFIKANEKKFLERKIPTLERYKEK